MKRLSISINYTNIRILFAAFTHHLIMADIKQWDTLCGRGSVCLTWYCVAWREMKVLDNASVSANANY